MAYDGSTILLDDNDKPVPQIWDDTAQKWVAYEGQAFDLENLVATETTLSDLLTNFNAEDFANETTLSSIDGKVAKETTLASIEGKDFSTETTLNALLTNFNSEDFASEITLSALKALFDTVGADDVGELIEKIEAKDFSTESTLNEILTAFNAEDFASETTLNTRLSSLETKMDTLLNSQDADNNLITKQTGSIVSINSDGTIADDDVTEYRGLSTDTKPTTDVPSYSTFVEMDTNNIYYYDGIDWQVY